MNTFSDYAQFKGAWTYYNKIENTQTIKGIVDLIQYHLIQPSLIAFDSRDLLGICSIGEYLRSIRTDKGIEELKAVNMPANVMALACGIGLVNPSDSTVERSEEHTSELQSRQYLVCRLL